MQSHGIESWLAVLGAPRGYSKLMAQGKNVVSSMEKHDDTNTHIDQKS